MNKLHILFFALLFTSGLWAQNFAVSHSTGEGASNIDNPENLVVIHYDGDNTGISIGDGGVTFIGGARFRPELTVPLTGGELQFVQFYYAEAATGLTILVYDAGTASEPGTLLLSQPLDLGSLTVGGWNEVALTTPVTITGNDLWVCLEVQDATGLNFPFGCDAGPADPDGNWVNDTGVWQHLTDFGLNYNWNIRGVVEDSPGGGPEPEMYLTHTPGDLNVGIYNTGAIGTNQYSASGPGVTWKGEQGLYMGGVLFGDSSTASVNGVFGSFTSGGLPVIDDLANVSSNFAAGFMSDGDFDQITEAVFYDSMAPVPYNVEIIQRSYSNTGDDFVFIRYGFINRSGANIVNGYAGIAIDWDVGAYVTNSGGYGLFNTFVYQWDTGPTSSYYFGIIALNGAGGMRATPASAFPTPRTSIFTWISTFNPTIPSNGDFRSYIGSGPGDDLAPGDTSWATFAIVAGDDLNQITNNAINASIKAYNLGWTDFFVPVELTAFTANVNNNGSVTLNWSTATELNNQMFEIERRSIGGQYITIGYVEGYGTTTENQDYSYVDNTVGTGTYFYRLKQIDFNGQYSYSEAVEVEVNGPLTFTLKQNYPNPFNPTTNIEYNIPETGVVKLAIYNSLGEEVAVLVDGMIEAGFYSVTFDASSLPSGAYFYRLQSGNSVEVKKLLLMK